ncbi:hypothetical protein ACIQUQ_16280 [Streptomyces sp. NPDC101118]|uniref:hypothetical protein n=1 Tax=Streptomyces sp. NPDC101118 TaxID=3366109 RepID=UPI00380E83FB
MPASCARHPVQAFRIGASAWSVRFHTDGDQPTGSDPWWDGLLGRLAELVAARAEHTATRAFFTRRAADWERRFAYQTPAYEAAVARMPRVPGGRVLDLGCGTGRAMPALRALRTTCSPRTTCAALEATGWRLAEYEDTARHFLARAEPAG